MIIRKRRCALLAHCLRLGTVSYILYQLQTIIPLETTKSFSHINTHAIYDLCMLMTEPSPETKEAVHSWGEAAGCLPPILGQGGKLGSSLKRKDQTPTGDRYQGTWTEK